MEMDVFAYVYMCAPGPVFASAHMRAACLNYSGKLASYLLSLLLQLHSHTT